MEIEFIKLENLMDYLFVYAFGVFLSFCGLLLDFYWKRKEIQEMKKKKKEPKEQGMKEVFFKRKKKSFIRSLF